MKISKLEKNLLNKEANLYSELQNNPPKWWKTILADEELYIDIRKMNIIDIYYLGGRLAQLKYDRGTKSIKATAHPKYVGKCDKLDNSAYRQRLKKGKIVYDPIYQDCESWLMPDKIADLKANVIKHYVNTPDSSEKEKVSEKFIQADLVLSGRDKYLDTEFQHRLFDGINESVRIDLVRIEDKKIIFEELKRIVDNRLLSEDVEQSEILTQIDNYRCFLVENKTELAEYYKTLYIIKQSLGLPVPPVADVNKLEVCTEPYLLIAKNYGSMGTGRMNRVKTIERMLKDHHVVYEIREME